MSSSLPLFKGKTGLRTEKTGGARVPGRIPAKLFSKWAEAHYTERFFCDILGNGTPSSIRICEKPHCVLLVSKIMNIGGHILWQILI